jgi:lipoprotein-anchoring transpeptidase ErfK/SrfK
VAGYRILTVDIATPRIWKVAILTAASAIGTASRVDAALYYWRDSEPGYSYQQEVQPPRKPQRARRGTPKKDVVVKDTTVHPQMPLIIAVSIQKQRIKVYDAKGFFAEAPVSTGMPGHPTPMGVFSVIEKDRYHHSNIYSGAPMPFMQRITWSGVAMHAGVLPGYPASHGCIRMPESFAIKMWGWTKMGARVIVMPGELPMPVSFSHPLLPTMKVVPQPPVAETDEPLGAKADKGAPDVKGQVTGANMELRPTVGHADVTPVALRDQTHTADASTDGSDIKSAATMSDVPKVAAKTDSTPSTQADPVNHATVAEAKTETQVETEESATAEGRLDASAKAEEQIETAAKIEAAKSAKTAAPVKVGETRVEPVKTEPPKVEPARPIDKKASDSKASDKPAESAKTAASVSDTPPSGPKDQTRITTADKPAARQPKRREGQIAVFISRKDSKLYVRQNFAPLFDVPVTIAPSDRPLGTHIFTAEIDKNDSNILHWSVVSVPTRSAMRDEPRVTRTKKGKLAPPPVEARSAPAVDTPAEALDRITIPAEAMARIVDALTTGGSIIVSDQGINQGDTGEGTDFIVSLR